jgi:hypothetical protein
MEQQSGFRKTYKYKLTPTPAQAQALETVLTRCCTLYNVAQQVLEDLPGLGDVCKG